VVVAVQAGKGSRDGRALAPGKVLTMGIDASWSPADDTPDRQPPTDLPVTRQPAEPQARARLPSSAERVEAHRQARRAADKEYAEQIGAEISAGHAFDKHVIERGEFPGVSTREQFASVIKDAVMSGEFRTLSRGRSAYWSEGIVVIRDPGAADGGTTFRPADGHDYFLGLH
jgi:hypothetical protein